MSDDLETPTDVPEDESSVIRDLREKARKFDEAEASTARLQRENVVLKAGLDLSDKQIKALQAAHEGDWDVDAIKATASELGFGKQSEPEQPKVPQSELDAMRRVQDADNSEPGPTAPEGIDAVVNAEYASADAYDAALRNAGILSNVRDT